MSRAQVIQASEQRVAAYLTPERLATWRKRLMLALTAMFVTFVFVEPASAQATGSDVSTLLQNIISFFNSGVVRAIAVIAVIILGLTCMFGVMDIRRAGLVILGIIIVFAATTIVGMVSGGGST